MKTLVSVMAAAAIVTAAVAPAMAAPICLESYLIDHTSVKDASTIQFHMKNGEVYTNTLKNACPGLNFHGFTMNIRGGNDQVCSNQQSISVLVTHETCLMGEFAKTQPKT